jgi:hypothetical protein
MFKGALAQATREEMLLLFRKISLWTLGKTFNASTITTPFILATFGSR